MAFDPQTAHSISSAKVFMVGAGGIGCELLKNLLLTGFRNVELIDLDTIEVSNLNRQFLFRSEHVGKPKAQIAAESAREMCPEAKVTWYHESVIQTKFNAKFFSQFDLVLNALDNASARSHVNRMCLAADRPLIESGSSGYLGNCKVIFKGKTECFDCLPPVPQKTFPGCTIRNTPSEPIHCIVWAKHLFNQLFGEADPDQDVSPNSALPDVSGDTESKQNGGNSSATEKGVSNDTAISTRERAVACGYNPTELFQKLFSEDIDYLLSMDKLWEKRRKPAALDLGAILKETGTGRTKAMSDESQHEDKRVWDLAENARVFLKSVTALKANLKNLGTLVWDKDDEVSLDFVTAVTNLRASCFGIALLSRYDTKQMAGNIIPAVASTNAIVAGFIILNAIKILQGTPDQCRNLITRVFRDAVPVKEPKRRVRITGVSKLSEPAPNCVSCSERVEIGVKLNVKTMSVKDFQEQLVKGHLKMSAPDVSFDDASGTIIISSDDLEAKNKDKTLSQLKVQDGTRLKCEDAVCDDYQVTITIHDTDLLAEGASFVLVDLAAANAESAAPDTLQHISSLKRKLEEEILTPATGIKRKQTEESLAEPDWNGNGVTEDCIDLSHRL